MRQKRTADAVFSGTRYTGVQINILLLFAPILRTVSNEKKKKKTKKQKRKDISTDPSVTFECQITSTPRKYRAN